MAYLEIKIPVIGELSEIIIAELSCLNFDSFEEKEDALMAYIEEHFFDKSVLDAVLNQYGISTQYAIGKLENKNWNEEWEKNFDAIAINKQCCVRAIFHPTQNLPYEIVINPRMAFGTGHHATTQLMMNAEFAIDFSQKKVIDAGCGTAVLAILAKKRGATSILANDIDEWAYENAIENCKLNNCQDIQVFQGTAEEVFSNAEKVDVILANINKNVLLAEMPVYANLLVAGGKLLLSGFYEEDADDIVERAKEFGFSFVEKNSKDRWTCMLLTN